MALEHIPLRQVTGTYLRPDGIKPSKGTVRFRPSHVLTVASDDLFVVPDPSVSVRLDAAGSFTVTLPVTVDPDWVPQGWVWVVEQTINGKPLPDGYLTLQSGTGAVDLSDAMVFETQTAAYPPGAFLPPGGATGYVLTKKTSADYNAEWRVPTGGGGGGGGGAVNFDDLLDVDLGGVTIGDTVQFNGSAWVPAVAGTADLVNNKSAITEFTDSTNDRFMGFDIDDDGTNTLNWPDRLQFRLETAPNSGVFARTGGFNEYGEARADAGRINTVASRVHGHASGSTGDIFQVRNMRGGSVDMLAVSTSAVKCQVPLTAPNLPPAILTLPVGTPVPGGTPAGTVIVRY